MPNRDRPGHNHRVYALDPPRRMATTLALVAVALLVAACSSSAPTAAPSTSSASPSPAPGQRFDVTTFGAKGDGQTDNTQAFSQAIAAAQAAGGGTVYVPAGQYVFSVTKTANPASISIEGSAPVTLMGAGRDTTALIEAKSGKGLLGVHVDGSLVEGLTLDTETHGGGSAIFVQGNHISLLHSRVLGGPKHFAIYFAGPKGAKPLSPLYNVGNTVNDVILTELDCDDGFSWSFQQGGTISDVTHTGSRLALYVDQTTTVTNYRYTPGSQQCGARNGFWITPPADHITITGFSSSGEGGKIGVIAAKGAGKLASNITITGETMTAAGYTLTIGDVSNLSLNNCNLGTDNIVIAAVATATGTVSRCKYGQLVRGGLPTANVAISVAPS
jgi:Pectate lyase superfamily protein